MNAIFVLSLAAFAIATPQLHIIEKQPIQLQFGSLQQQRPNPNYQITLGGPNGGGSTSTFTSWSSNTQNSNGYNNAGNNGGISGFGGNNAGFGNNEDKGAGSGDNNAENQNSGAGYSGQCIGLHGRCNLAAAINPLGKAQCCKGLRCQLSILEGIIWPTVACTNIMEKIGMGNGQVYDKPVGS